MITDANIREYLLGRLDPYSKLAESIDEQTFTDPSFSADVDVIEDELIEEYLEGTLRPEEVRAFERHFLRPAERKRKLEVARLLSRHFEAEADKVEPISPAPRRLFDMFRNGKMLPSFRTCAEIAASIVFVIAMMNFWHQRRELNTAIQQMTQQLAQERGFLAVTKQELQNALQSTQPAIAMLNLVRPGLVRGEQELPSVKVSPGTKTLRVEVALVSRTVGNHRVQLRQAGKLIWSKEGVDAATVPGGAILIVDIPAAILSDGKGELAITRSDNSTISYWFSISKIQ